MVNANELRIGNWVRQTDIDFIFQVNAYGILRFSENKSDNIDPIPLSPEILEKAGFRYAIGSVSRIVDYSKDGVRLNVKDGAFEFTYFPTVIKYVHQLQNLFYILTGQELEITL